MIGFFPERKCETQQNRSWELSAGISMNRFGRRLGDADQTRLAEVYSSFSQGFETADLKMAMELLKVTSRV